MLSITIVNYFGSFIQNWDLPSVMINFVLVDFAQSLDISKVLYLTSLSVIDALTVSCACLIAEASINIRITPFVVFLFQGGLLFFVLKG